MSEKKQKTNPVDIFSMLSKAQEDFNRTPSKTETQPQFSSTPRAPDVTSQSVMDFFAKASSKTTKPPTVNPVESENLLQRLMSNPEHSVEHIEKQQRSVTPQEQVLLRKKSNSTSDRRSVPINFTNAQKSENGLSFITLGSPPQNNLLTGSSPLSSFFAQPQSAAVLEEREVTVSPLASLLETPQKPTLLPPIMFTSTSPKDKEEAAPNKTKEVEPLTKNQMIQALTYLLKNDPDFVTKLHEAYVKSITEMVHSNCNNSIL